MNLAQTEDDLVGEIAVMFGDAMMVRCVPTDYAKSVITKVREFDRAQREMEMQADADSVSSAQTPNLAEALARDDGST